MEFIVFFIVVGIVLKFFVKKEEKKNQQKKVTLDVKISNYLGAIGFQSNKQYLNEKIGKGIYYDDSNQRFALLSFNPIGESGSQHHNWSVINCKDIIESEVIIDNVSVTKTSRGSQVGGALVGGVLAGGLGALVGGVTGSKNTSEKIKMVELKLVLNDTLSPIKSIKFLELSEPKEKEDIDVKRAITHVESFHKTVSVILKKNEEENQSNLQKSNQLSLSTSDEIRKLSELFKEGILTEEEYKKEKQKLLSS
jgi:hypothetical protein